MMKKISTLYRKDPNNLSIVINEVDYSNEWVFGPDVVATQKFDGTACMIKDGRLFKRYDAKTGRQVPKNGIACQEKDPITGHQPFWVPCIWDLPEDKYFWEGLDTLNPITEGMYELCGEKVQRNPEKIIGHKLLKHGSVVLDVKDYSFDGLKQYLSNPKNNIEGIVFHHKDGRMCKIRKSDFGFKR